MRNRMRELSVVTAFLFMGLCMLVLYAAYNRPVFEGGANHTFYLQKNSSCGVVTTEFPALWKLILGNAAGESVTYEGDRVEELRKKFDAKLLFTESACGVTNYYLYSPKLKDCVFLSGYAVNLHLASADGRTAAGTPLIFGGF